MSYPYSPLIDELQQIRTPSLSPVQKYLKELKLYMDTHRVKGRDPILIFHFLIRYVEETGKLIMSKDQASILMPQFLTNPTATSFVLFKHDHVIEELLVGPSLYNIYSKYTPHQALYVRTVLVFKQFHSKRPTRISKTPAVLANPFIINVHDEVNKIRLLKPSSHVSSQFLNSL